MKRDILIGAGSVAFILGALFGINPSAPRTTYSVDTNVSTSSTTCQDVTELTVSTSVGSRYRMSCGFRMRTNGIGGMKLCVSAPTTSVTPAGVMVANGQALQLLGIGTGITIPGIIGTTSYGTFDVNFGRIMAPGDIVIQFAHTTGLGNGIVEDGSQCEVNTY